ncbi:hypothetical protein P170DRAFT_83508 [Aspergillus steynii IBT 23096]|uniref:Uncharacterized protein n=1 Tax=Aspergillus steynii IBT 23096 TaxID=1392250 RepID=A0A2I2GFN6_9EURO|nr:uncharacterized protein P170DRAFT_83508 [Aspergillus steynii IBT 23096]PLB51694.1 hypothetical protein P170DRAFT_83508 [Aspergillus steynii IBT 23096]
MAGGKEQVHHAASHIESSQRPRIGCETRLRRRLPLRFIASNWRLRVHCQADLSRLEKVRAYNVNTRVSRSSTTCCIGFFFVGHPAAPFFICPFLGETRLFTLCMYGCIRRKRFSGLSWEAGGSVAQRRDYIMGSTIRMSLCSGEYEKRFMTHATLSPL